jgi:hypothetical protein
MCSRSCSSVLALRVRTASWSLLQRRDQHFQRRQRIVVRQLHRETAPRGARRGGIA